MQNTEPNGLFGGKYGCHSGNQQGGSHTVNAPAEVVPGQQTADAGKEHKQSRKDVTKHIHRGRIKKGQAYGLGINQVVNEMINYHANNGKATYLIQKNDPFLENLIQSSAASFGDFAVVFYENFYIV